MIVIETKQGFIEFEDKDEQQEIRIEVDSIGVYINKDQAQQIITHLQQQFNL